MTTLNPTTQPSTDLSTSLSRRATCQGLTRNRLLRRAGLAVVAGAATLAIAACGSSDDPMGGQHMSPHATPSTGSSAAPSSAEEVFNDADVMFTEMMIPHHRQAVEMSDLILAKTGIDPEVKTLAGQIKGAQQPEIDTMNTWLEAWGANMPDHGGMDHGSDNGGMMTPEDMQALKAADAAEGQKIYLSGMVKHHQGAITMAQTEIADGKNSDAIALANSIVTSQQAEITTMQAILNRL